MASENIIMAMVKEGADRQVVLLVQQSSVVHIRFYPGCGRKVFSYSKHDLAGMSTP